MVTEIEFSILVKASYSFLENDYGYNFVDTLEVPREVSVRYRRGELMVVIKYSRVNKNIEVHIYNHVSNVNPGAYKWKYSLMLLSLVHKLNPSFDYESIMPKNIPLVESVSKAASLLKYYGDTILNGTEWISNGDITGHNQYVPPELP